MNGSVARRYAKALLDIGQAAHSSEALQHELLLVNAALERSTELTAVLADPVFKVSQRRAVLEELSRRLALSRTVHNLLLLLLERRRIPALPAIAREHGQMVDGAANRVRAVVTTAEPLGKKLEERLLAALERQTGKTVLIEKRQDAELIGGIVCQIGDVRYDGSVRTQLDHLRRRLRAS